MADVFRYFEVLKKKTKEKKQERDTGGVMRYSNSQELRLIEIFFNALKVCKIDLCGNQHR